MAARAGQSTTATRARKTPAQRAEEGVKKAQQAVDRAAKRYEKAAEKVNKANEELAEATAAQDAALAELNYANANPALPAQEAPVPVPDSSVVENAEDVSGR
jgi:seryl-tRNA synthetase